MKIAAITLGMLILAALTFKGNSAGGRTRLHYGRPTENFFHEVVVNTNAVGRTIRNLKRQGYVVTYMKKLK